MFSFAFQTGFSIKSKPFGLLKFHFLAQFAPSLHPARSRDKFGLRFGQTAILTWAMFKSIHEQVAITSFL
jgi:hypothetical protein